MRNHPERRQQLDALCMKKKKGGKRYNHLFLFFSESFVLGLLWGVLAVPDLEILSSLRRLLRKKEERKI